MKVRVKHGAVLEVLASDYTRLQTLWLSMKDQEFSHKIVQNNPLAMGPATTAEQGMDAMKNLAAFMQRNSNE